jgi:hypothetical protein
MNNPLADIELLRFFDALRPREYRATIVAPDGSVTYDRYFSTKEGARAYGTATRQTADMVIYRRVDRCSEN